MKRKDMKRTIYVFTIVLSMLFILLGNRQFSEKRVYGAQASDHAVAVATIIEITNVIEESIQTSGNYAIEVKDIFFKARISRGEEKGIEVIGYQNINPYMAVKPREVSVGDKVMLYQMLDGHLGYDWVFGDFIRSDALIVLASVFALLLIVFGLGKGLKTLVSLVFTLLAIFAVFIPAVLAGSNVYLWSIIICAYTIVFTMIIVSGVERKTLAAAIGCFSGLAFSGTLIWVMDFSLRLTGLINDESIYLIMMNPDNPLDLKALVFGAILIGAMGAIMDVAMSIASSLQEIKYQNPAANFTSLVRSAMVIGRDIMGTMANTLILAYIGGSLTLVLLLISYTSSAVELMNRELVVVEVLQALVGSMGILMTIPLTAVVSAFLYTKRDKKAL